MGFDSKAFAKLTPKAQRDFNNAILSGNEQAIKNLAFDSRYSNVLTEYNPFKYIV